MINSVIMQQIVFLVCLNLLTSLCYCQSAYFKLEHEDASIIKTNDVKPFLNESICSEIECHMICLGNQDKCCLVEIKEKPGKAMSCLIYDVSPVYLSKTYEKHSKITSVVDRDCKPKSCLEWYQNGWKEDGVYEIHVNGNQVKVFCDMTTDGGGWTVFLRRFDGSVSFSQTWDKYKNGFGDATGEYWLGNDLIHQFTNKAEGTLIKFKATSLDNISKHIIYNRFKIDSEENRYKMQIGNVVGGDEYLVNYEDKLGALNGVYFSTKDQDNDVASGHCAQALGGGGFWYKTCSYITPTSGYPNGGCDEKNCMRWMNWESGITYLKFFQMSVK